MHDILDSVKDEPLVSRKLSETIVKYANMADKELVEQIKAINNGLTQAEQKKQFIVDLYNSKDCSKLVSISNDGKTMQTIGKNAFAIEDEKLQEKILLQIYFQEKGFSKEEFGKNVKRICENLEQDSDLRFGDGEKTALDRKKALSAIKVMARENGYMVLSSLEECESGKNVPLQAIKVQKGEKVSFQDLKSIYERFEIDYKDKSWTQLYVKDRKTGKEINDLQVEKIAKFASIWVGSAGTKWLADEELRGITYAFNESSERIYEQVGELVGKCINDSGMIDTQAIYDELSKDKYKHSEEIIRNLFSNRANMNIMYDFYKMQNEQAKMETTLSKTIYGISERNIDETEVERLVKSIPDFTSKDTRERIDEEQVQAELVTLPNGAKIPRKQYEEEFKEVILNKANESLKHESVRKGIINSTVTENEIQDVQQALKEEISQRKELSQLQFLGKNRTAEQQRRFLELQHIYQTNQMQVRQESKDNRMNR